jgi:mitofusin
LTTDLAQGLEELKQKKEDVGKVKRESEVARKYFGNLVRDSSEARRRVAGIDLEGPPGVVGSYGS